MVSPFSPHSRINRFATAVLVSTHAPPFWKLDTFNVQKGLGLCGRYMILLVYISTIGGILCRPNRNFIAAWCPMPQVGHCSASGTSWQMTLSDERCFQKIEAVVTLLEELGISCGGRHDFG